MDFVAKRFANNGGNGGRACLRVVARGAKAYAAELRDPEYDPAPAPGRA